MKDYRNYIDYHNYLEFSELQRLNYKEAKYMQKFVLY